VSAAAPLSTGVKALRHRVPTLSCASSLTQISASPPFSKSFASQGAYHTHVESKKHRDREVQEATRLLKESMLAAQAPKDENALPEHVPTKPVYDEVPSSTAAHSQSYHNHPHPDQAAPPSLAVDADATEEELADSIDRKIAYARLRLTPTSCLFCSVTPFADQEETARHMQKEHGFFIPDREYLVDLPGLLLYLGEKVSIGNVCLSCNGKGKEYRTLEAVRKHMIDKSHCKVRRSFDLYSAAPHLTDPYL
jgi:pre-60S factor REI1